MAPSMGGVEADGGGRVDDDVAAGQDPAALVVEAQPVGADIAGDDLDPTVDPIPEGVLALLVEEAAEGVVAEHLASGPLGRCRPLSRPDQEHELTIGGGSHQPLHQRRAQEPGGAGDGDALPAQLVGNHSAGPLASGSKRIYHLVSGWREHQA